MSAVDPVKSYNYEQYLEKIDVKGKSPSEVFFALKNFCQPESETPVSNQDRFPDIRLVKGTKVRMDPSHSEANPEINYRLHGSYVSLLPGSLFIATQTPRWDHAREGDQRFSEPYLFEWLFWRAFEENNVKGIINLTNSIPAEKCEGYTATLTTPIYRNYDKTTKKCYEDFHVNEEYSDHYTASEHAFRSFSPTSLLESELSNEESFNLQNINTPERDNTPERNWDFDDVKEPKLVVIPEDAKRYVYVKVRSWMDREAVTVERLAALVEKVNKIREANQNGIVMIHCRAGVGRTCTLIVACAIHELVAKRVLTQDNRSETIAALVISARMQRGPLSVQTREQMELLFKYAENEERNLL